MTDLVEGNGSALREALGDSDLFLRLVKDIGLRKALQQQGVKFSAERGSGPAKHDAIEILEGLVPTLEWDTYTIFQRFCRRPPVSVSFICMPRGMAHMLRV